MIAEATMFLLSVSYLAYVSGPVIKALPMRAVIIAIVKTRENLEGARGKSGMLQKAKNRKNPLIAKNINALVISLYSYLLCLLLLEDKLKYLD